MMAHYLSDVVYGSIDGTITTFAIVSGIAGASLSSDIVIIMGLANVFADGFSMAVASYLSAKTEADQHMHFDKSPIIVAIVTFLSFVLIGLVPILVFIISYILDIHSHYVFYISYLMTAISLFLIGAIRGKLVDKPILENGMKTFVVGGFAALISFFVGYLFRGVVPK